MIIITRYKDSIQGEPGIVFMVVLINKTTKQKYNDIILIVTFNEKIDVYNNITRPAKLLFIVKTQKP